MQRGCYHRAEDKIAALLWLVREAIGERAPTLVFASTRHHVEFLHTLMTKEGIDAACVYGAMDQVCCFPDAAPIVGTCCV